MRTLLNGFQCEKCNTIYASKEKAKTCEEKAMEEPLLQIGDVLIDDSYEVESEMRVCKISFEGHQVNYRMEWEKPDRNEEWEEVYTIFGNKMLNDFN